MTQPRTIEGRQLTSFVESQSRPKNSAREVYVGNTQPIEVDFVEGGTLINSYNELLSLAGLASANIVLYTVPVGKKLRLKRIDFSGENKAVFKIDLNGLIQAKSRTWFTQFNGNIIFNDLTLIAGDVVKLIVENKTNAIADFNGNLQGKLLDA